jgi:predicted dinucleotide-binding enzyme
MMGSRAAGNEKAVAWAKSLGARASEGSFADAARFGEILVFATKGSAVLDVVEAAGADSFRGKVIIDSTNPLDFSHGFPDLFVKGTDSLGEQLQRAVPEAKVVKCFNTTTASLMFRPELAGGPPDMFIAGDDAGAKEVVRGILKDFGWLVVDCGPLYSARWLEPMTMAWVHAAQNKGTWRLAWKVLG